jgi:hypothetical protein
MPANPRSQVAQVRYCSKCPSPIIRIGIGGSYADFNSLSYTVALYYNLPLGVDAGGRKNVLSKQCSIVAVQLPRDIWLVGAISCSIFQHHDDSRRLRPSLIVNVITPFAAATSQGAWLRLISVERT